MKNLERLSLDSYDVTTSPLLSASTTLTHFVHLRRFNSDALSEFLESQPSLEYLELEHAWGIEIRKDALMRLKTFVGPSGFWESIASERQVEHLNDRHSEEYHGSATESIYRRLRSLKISSMNPPALKFLENLEYLRIDESYRGHLGKLVTSIPSIHLHYIYLGSPSEEALHSIPRMFQTFPQLEAVDHGPSQDDLCVGHRYARNSEHPSMVTLSAAPTWEHWWSSLNP
ncbi:hypothetical protein ONZ45_g9244 [Pleurotus djamor]|nr:hypothetical protein ONZ45_g9244 [Pleurotus djamor]